LETFCPADEQLAGRFRGRAVRRATGGALADMIEKTGHRYRYCPSGRACGVADVAAVAVTRRRRRRNRTLRLPTPAPPTTCLHHPALPAELGSAARTRTFCRAMPLLRLRRACCGLCRLLISVPALGD